MRIALIGDFDTFAIRGLERPRELLPARLSPGLNLLRGFRELGAHEIHVVVGTEEVSKPTVEQGPLGVVHRLPRPKLSGSACLFLWRRALLLRELRAISPDIVHGQGTECEYAFTAVTSPYPNVITIHGIMHRVQRVTPPPLLSLDHVPRWIETLVVRKAQDVICLSGEAEDFLQERSSPARRHRIPNAIGPCFFEVQPESGHNGFSLLFVGTICQLKGLVHLVEALAIAQRRLNAPVTLRVVGRTPVTGEPAAYDKFVHRRASELGVADNIKWLGALGEREVAAALAQSDALVLPSFQETSPMCIAEAMAAGVPVIASRVGGIPDVVDEEQTGVLVMPGHSDELADAIGRLLSDVPLRRKYGAEGRAKALAEYAPRVVAKKTLAVYQEILSPQSHSRT